MPNAVASSSNTSKPPHAVVPLDPYRPLPSALRKPILTFTADYNPNVPTSVQALLSLTPIAYSSRLASKQLLLDTPPNSGNPLEEAAKESAIRKGKKRRLEDLDVGNVKLARDTTKALKRKKLGQLSKAQLKKKKLHKLRAGSKIDYDALRPLYYMHLGYLSELLGLPGYEQDEENRLQASELSRTNGGKSVNGLNTETMMGRLVKCDMVGAKIRVKSAKNSCLIGQGGIVLQETAHTFKLITSKSILKVIPKANSLFTLSFPAYSLSSLPSSPASPNVLYATTLSSPPTAPFLRSYDPLKAITEAATTAPSGTSSDLASIKTAFQRVLETIPMIEVDILGSAFMFRSEERAGRRFKPKEAGGGWEESWVGWWGDEAVGL